MNIKEVAFLEGRLSSSQSKHLMSF